MGFAGAHGVVRRPLLGIKPKITSLSSGILGIRLTAKGTSKV